MSEPKYSVELKLKITKEYLSGAGSYRSIAKKYGIGAVTLERWVLKYQEQGEAGLLPRSGLSTYTSEFKTKCVEAYLRGEGSPEYLTVKYNISDSTVLRYWIQLYNANKELKNFEPKSEVYMAGKSRKTTLEERKEIAEYCIAHGMNYKDAAAFYNVSYCQAYRWTKKYFSEGEEGLVDKRGHHKNDNEVGELEQLRRENARLKRQLEERDMTVELLKKAKEFERM